MPPQYAWLLFAINRLAELNDHKVQLVRVVTPYGDPIVVLQAPNPEEALMFVANMCTVPTEPCIADVEAEKMLLVRKTMACSFPEAVGLAIEPL
jgi:hypothetical protein